MATLSAISTAVQRNAAGKITQAEADAFIQTAYTQIWEAHEWMARKVDALVALVADYKTGTLTATQGSATLVGVGTTWASGMVNRWIRIGSANELYRVATYVDATHLTIESPTGGTGWQAATTAAATYVIFQHVYKLASDVDQVLLPTREYALHETTKEQIDAIDPARTSTGTTMAWAPRELASDGAYQIELWPRPNVAGVMRTPYLKKAPTLGQSTDVLIRQDPIEYLASQKAALFLLAKHGDQRYGTLAQMFWVLYSGDPNDKKLGALETAIMQDQKKYGSIHHLPDKTSAGSGWSDEFLASHDFEVF